MTIEKKIWNGNLFILTDGKVMVKLSELEYRLYLALKCESYNDGNGKHYLYERQCEFSHLERELMLENGLNKKGDVSYMSRQTISKTFKSLVEKEILIYGELFKGENGYHIITEEDPLEGKYKFVQIKSSTLRKLSKAFKGQPLKLYLYLKGVFDSNKGQPFKINRETIALAINEVSKSGKVGKRQLDNITDFIDIFYSMNLINVEVSTKRQDNGTYTSIYHIKDVNDDLKKVRKKRA